MYVYSQWQCCHDLQRAVVPQLQQVSNIRLGEVAYLNFVVKQLRIAIQHRTLHLYAFKVVAVYRTIWECPIPTGN